MAFPMQVFEQQGCGRGCRAKRKLAAGEVVLRCAPIAAALEDRELPRRCNRCLCLFDDPDDAKICRTCGIARFCSKCAEDSTLVEDHSAECWALAVLLGDANRGIRDRLLAQSGIDVARGS